MNWNQKRLAPAPQHYKLLDGCLIEEKFVLHAVFRIFLHYIADPDPGSHQSPLGSETRSRGWKSTGTNMQDNFSQQNVFNYFFLNFYIISLSAQSSHHEPQVLFMFVCLLDPNLPSGSGSIRSPTVRIRIRNTGVHVHTELPKLGPKWAGAGQVQVTGQLQDGDTQREHITGLTHTRGHVVSSVVDPNRLYLDPDPSVSDPDPDSWVFCIRIRNPDPGSKKKFKMLNHHNII